MDPNQMPVSGVKAIKHNMVAMTKLYDSLSKNCFKKCVTRFSQPDLAVGELTCVDRCTLKYMATAKIVTEQMQKAAEMNMQRQQAMQSVMGSNRP
mmetsp:Transcript_10732/g.15992  ORF Transcript_10732/g.15992 Transcript_10732/m.15992 type:complete len:95 (+) Transcript_10732:18-302(+)